MFSTDIYFLTYLDKLNEWLHYISPLYPRTTRRQELLDVGSILYPYNIGIRKSVTPPFSASHPQNHGIPDTYQNTPPVPCEFKLIFISSCIHECFTKKLQNESTSK